MTRRPAGSEGGFTYIAAMVAVIIMGITLGSAATFWSTRMQREKEEELLFRGTQYRDAIRVWKGYDPVTHKVDPERRKRLGLPSVGALTELSQLERKPNGPGTLRKLYKDPITGEDFLPVKDASQEIIGVKSPSEKKPLKQANFPDDPAEGLEPGDFEGKEKYSDWQFIYNRWPQPKQEGKQNLPGN